MCLALLTLLAIFVYSGKSQKPNAFVEGTITTTVQTLCSGVLVADALRDILSAAASVDAVLHIQLNADNDFYSQRAHVCGGCNSFAAASATTHSPTCLFPQLLERKLPVCSASLAKLPPFMPCPTGATTCRLCCTPLLPSPALPTGRLGWQGNHCQDRHGQLSQLGDRIDDMLGGAVRGRCCAWYVAHVPASVSVDI